MQGSISMCLFSFFRGRTLITGGRELSLSRSLLGPSCCPGYELFPVAALPFPAGYWRAESVREGMLVTPQLSMFLLIPGVARVPMQSILGNCM